MRFTVSEDAKDELLDRLLMLNHGTAAEVAARQHGRRQGGTEEAGRTPQTRPESPVSAMPSPPELRAELEQLMMTDLLRSVRAPRAAARCSQPGSGVVPGRDARSDWHDRGPEPRGDGDDLQHGDEGGAPGPDNRPAKVVLFPSSVGLTAAVDLSCSSLEVTASWGRYEKMKKCRPKGSARIPAALAKASRWRLVPALCP